MAVEVEYRTFATATGGRNGTAQTEEGGFGIKADLMVSLSGPDRQDAQPLIDAAQQVCPYSNGTRGNVEVHLA